MRISFSTFRNVLLSFSLLFLMSNIYAQKDTLKQKLFGHEDLVEIENEANKIVTSVSFLAENYEDQAQEVIVIDGDDIRKFGYTTLVDVLKSIPGFRTSQPGNALEGETFLMRGLYGNDHTKILINGIPVKPEAVRAMPIASQLPIRHAERIEIVMGPSSAAYGTDAMAGVINIVLPEVDRPVFAWADINLMNNRTSEFNLTLGGKIGKGKNILNYQLFASSYKAEDQNIYIPDDSIQVILTDDPEGVHQLDSAQWPFFVSGNSPNLPEIDFLPKESRLVGGNLKYRWFEFSLMNMYRADHSAIGSFPTVNAYHNPNWFIGENINSVTLKYQDEKDKRYTSRVLASGLFYRMLPSSSYYGINHSLSNGQNFMYARSIDLRGEYQGVFKINKQMNLVGGIVGQYSYSHVFTNFLGRPFKYYDPVYSLPNSSLALETASGVSFEVDAISDLDTVTYIPTYEATDVAGFLQYSYMSKSKNFSLVVGTRMVSNDLDELVFTPKLGVMYRPVDRLRLRFFYGSGHRAPRSYHLYSTYTSPANQFNGDDEKLRRQGMNPGLTSEFLHGLEIAIQYKPIGAWTIDANVFAHQLSNRVIRQFQDPPDTLIGPPPPPGSPGSTYGFSFFNGTSAATLISGILNVSYRKQFNTRTALRMDLSYQYAIGEERVVPNDNSPQSDEQEAPYRYMPINTLKFNVVADFFGFTLAINNQVFGNYATDVYRINSTVDYRIESRYFYNMDISLHKTLFRQLGVVAGIGNVFRTVQSGIANANLGNTWHYNPQYGRTYKIGLTFKLN